ncbi:LamG-like jellyroll fold domain-containing protein [Achromobacter sp. NPDC058515]|uniref:LamG-like jellyroll fold domain-containing protein n=1 Tax=Achromobacter sp. NPDC058515 TaxID=3346533 RepID=UPI00364D5BD6
MSSDQKENGIGQDAEDGLQQDGVNTRRRSLIKAGVGTWALPAGLTSLLAACGGDDDDDDAAPSPGGGDEGGTEPPPAAKLLSSFGLVVLPDTQFYARYATAETGNQFAKLFGSEPFMAQTDWIARSAKALNVPFVIHVGDVVDQVSKPQQWEVADAAMKRLEAAGVPYSILAGNHDVLQDIGFESDPVNGTDATRDLAAEPYLKWFGKDRASAQATFGGRDASGFHEYHVFEAEGQKFLVLSLSWRVSDAGLAWARQVLQTHSSLPAILVNHQLLAIANDGVSPLEVDYGLMLWDKLIRGNDQIFMTVNGHHHGAAHLTKINDFGHAVEEMVVDYQMAYQGGNGLLRFYEFDLSNNRIVASSFSPWVPQKPKNAVNEFDQAVLTDANNQFVIEMDFAKRFAAFNPNFKAGPGSREGSVSEAALALALNGFADVKPPEKAAPANDEDYAHAAGTLAHWRFVGGAAGTAVAQGAVVADKSGNNNPLTRAPLNAPAGNTAQEGDLVWSADRHRLSAAPGSVTFRNTAGPRLSYFLTDVAATLNAETFTGGYTVEAFIKIAGDWTAAANAWMNIMTRAGRRGNLPGWAASLPQSPPLQFAISNLREVQWEVVPSSVTPVTARTNWSGEILVDTWLHVAVVNDPATRETTMYVEGAPVLRNAVDGVGLATLGLPWTVGAGYWDGGDPSGGFLGALGEIRVVGKPLQPSEWLTARAS